jgi:hypothetical protein
MIWPFHSHRYDRRDRVNGVLVLCCTCGKSVPAIARTRAELKVMARKFPVPPVSTAQGSRKVVTMKAGKR